MEECELDLNHPRVKVMGNSSSTCAYFKVFGHDVEGDPAPFCQIKVYDKILEMICRGHTIGVGSKLPLLLGADNQISPKLKESVDLCR